MKKTVIKIKGLKKVERKVKAVQKALKELNESVAKISVQ